VDRAGELLESIRPQLAAMESDRQQGIAKAKKWAWIGAAVILLSCALFVVHVAIGGAILALGVLVGIVPWRIQLGIFKDKFKKDVFPQLANAICPGVKFSASKKISIRQFEDSRLFLTHPNRYRGEDFFEAKVGKTDLVFSEIHAEEKVTTHTSKGRTQTHYVTIFKGLFFITEFHKNFEGQTFVLPDFTESWLGRIGRKLQKWNWSRPDLVELESPDFEKHFVVYSTNQIEARYLITPDMMERIVELKRVFGGDVHLSFIHSKLYIAISQSRNFFEVSFGKSLLNSPQIVRILRELDLCFGLVELMDLNTRIWSKK